MKQSYNIDSKYNDMRIDRWIRNNIGHMPQSLIEKFLRNGKIKLNKKKVKSSTKVKTNDLIDLFNLNYQPKIITANNKLDPSPSVIKANEKLIIDDNENFVVINKMAGTSVQGGTKSRKNIIDILSDSNNYRIRVAIARRSSTSSEIIEKLKNDDDEVLGYEAIFFM